MSAPRYTGEMGDLRAEVERLREALRKITQAEWNANTKETPFQFEQRIHRIAAMPCPECFGKGLQNQDDQPGILLGPLGEFPCKRCNGTGKVAVASSYKSSPDG